MLKAERFITILEDQVRALEAQRAAVEKTVQAGAVAKIDLLRTEVALAGARESLVKARANRQIAVAALAEAIGLPADAPLRVSDQASEPPLPATREEAIAEALRRRPELEEVAAGQRAARAGTDLARSARRPQIAAFAQTDFARPSYAPKTGTWSAGMQLTYNLFDGDAAKAQAAQAQAALAKLEAARAELENGIGLEVTQRYLEVTSARERIATTETAVAAAAESHRLATVGYQNGVMPLTDLLQAQAELTRARADALIAHTDLRAAQQRLLHALGR